MPSTSSSPVKPCAVLYARDGAPPYTPYLYALKLFPDQFRDAAARILPAYIDGTRTLPEAAGDLVRALVMP